MLQSCFFFLLFANLLLRRLQHGLPPKPTSINALDLVCSALRRRCGARSVKEVGKTAPPSVSRSSLCNSNLAYAA